MPVEKILLYQLSNPPPQIFEEFLDYILSIFIHPRQAVEIRLKTRILDLMDFGLNNQSNWNNFTTPVGFSPFET